SELRARRAEAQDRLAAVSAEVDELRAERPPTWSGASAEPGPSWTPGRAVGEEQRARLEARLAELTDTAADLRERLAASLASQRRQQMELVRELMLGRGAAVPAAAAAAAAAKHDNFAIDSLIFFSPAISCPPLAEPQSHLSPPRATPTGAAGRFGFDSGLAGDCLGESLFSELAGFGASAARMDGLYDEDIEEDEADAPVAASAAAPAASGEAETRSEEFFEEDGVAAAENLQTELQLKNQQLEEQSCELRQTKSELSFQQRQTEALLANESAMKRDQKDAAEKRICLESQLSRMKAEVERLNSELNIGGCSREN
uniref:BZIP domain-containing protein n=1 Tax=Macrostomum lignano TaxID=282301 RepID=A0A1I8FQ78_9PLAT